MFAFYININIAFFSPYEYEVLTAVDVIVVRVDWTIVDFSVDITVDNNSVVGNNVEIFVLSFVDAGVVTEDDSVVTEEVDIVVNSVDAIVVKVEVTIVDCWVDLELDSNGILEVSIGDTVVKVEAIVKSVFKGKNILNNYHRMLYLLSKLTKTLLLAMMLKSLY